MTEREDSDGTAAPAQEAAGTPNVPAVAPRRRVVYALETEQASAPLSAQERDFVLLTLFVLVQHRQYGKASVISEALIRAGDSSAEALLGHAVIAFCREDYPSVLDSLARLDRIDPIERYGQRQGTERERMRSYLRARSLYEQGEGKRNAIDLYLRHTQGNGSDVDDANS